MITTDQILSSPTLATELGLGCLALGSVLSAVWYAATRGQGSQLSLYVSVLVGGAIGFLSVPELPFVLARMLKGMFFTLAMPAVGWASFLVVVFAVAWMLGHQGSRTSRSRSGLQHPRCDLQRPRSALRGDSSPAVEVKEASQPVRLERQSTALSVPSPKVPKEYRREVVRGSWRR